jgi:hypothetical protein
MVFIKGISLCCSLSRYPTIGELSWINACSFGQSVRGKDLHMKEQGTKEFQKTIDTVFATGRSVQQEHKSHRDNKYFLRTFSPVKDRLGMVEAVTVVSKDVTSLK